MAARPPARPPRLTRLLLRAILALRGQPPLVHEMDELFARRVEREGSRAAHRWYRRQVPGFLLRWGGLRPAVSPGGSPSPLASVGEDLAHAWRAVTRAPGPTAVAVATLGLGVGAASGVFSVVDGALLRPLPFEDDRAIVRLWAASPARGLDHFSVSPLDYLDWARETRAFAGMTAYDAPASRTLATGETPLEVQVSRVEPDLFELLGVRTVLGRPFATSDVDAAVVVLGHDLWTSGFGRDAGVVGTTLTFDGEPFEVVGVAPPDFLIPNNLADAYTPLNLAAETDRGNRYLRVLGRLAPGHGTEDARAELDAFSARLAEAYPATNTGWGVAMESLFDTVVDPPTQRGMWILLGVVGLVLLVGCGNVGALGLARAAEREHEIAVRSALGATRGRLARQLVLESLLVAAGAAAAGTGLAALGVAVARRAGPVGIPRLSEVTVDGRVLLVAAGLALLASIASGLLPSLVGMRRALASLVRARSASSPGRRPAARDALVTGQVAVSMVLLVGASLLLRSFQRLQDRDLGFDPRGVLTAHISLPESRYPSPDASQAFFRELLDRVGAVAEVESVSAASGLPFVDRNSGMVFARADGIPLARESAPDADYRAVAPGYFATMRLPVLAGDTRMFDDPASGPLVIVSAITARRHWPGEDPVGRQIRIGDPIEGPLCTVAAVVGDGRYYALDGEDERAMLYFPLAQFRGRSLTLAVRTGAPETAATMLRSVVAELDRSLPAPEVGTLEGVLSDALAERRFQAWALGALAVAALLLAAVGIYGVTALGARRRSAEIGVRIALGARPASVVGQLTARGTGLALVGVGLGALGGVFLVGVVESLLYQTPPRDAVSFLASAGLLVGVSALANGIPARRAARMDPSAALRPD